MRVEITDWKVLIKVIWKLEMWFQDNYRQLDNKTRKEGRAYLDKLTDILEEMKEKTQKGEEKT